MPKIAVLKQGSTLPECSIILESTLENKVYSISHRKSAKSTVTLKGFRLHNNFPFPSNGQAYIGGKHETVFAVFIISGVK